MSTDLPFTLETALERRIAADQDWRAGIEWGEPRPGHPEGAVKHHVAEVLANVDRSARSPRERRRLRLAALLHDTFKHRVDPTTPREGENHHGMLARRFAERYLRRDPGLLTVLELHDEAYNAWLRSTRRDPEHAAEARAARLLARLGPDLGLYLAFLRCDNETGSKSAEAVAWFEAFVRRSHAAPPDGPG